MPNDKDWQRRSDEWVKSMHESSLCKKRRSITQKKNKDTQKKPISKACQ
ncbi:MAG: hypothetical protein ACI9IA_000081 [Enterobacterales bacterium]|jgi:hypothetical protein